jgi:HEAT repeat protein
MKTRFDLKLENDSTPSREIVKKYRQVIDQEDYDESLVLIHYRGGAEEFALGLDYCHSKDSLDRATGADILGQLGWTDNTFLDESVEVLIPMLKDSDSNVASCAATALGHRSDPIAIPYLIDISNHEDPQVRNSVVFGLLGHDAPEAISALILLSSDSNSDVRNWAIFGLGSQIDIDTPEIKQALFAGLSDSDDEIRGEAMLGLAVRGDCRIVDLILKEWEGQTISRLSLEAAEASGDPRLYSCLVSFLDNIDMDEDPAFREQLEQAIAACRLNLEEV